MSAAIVPILLAAKDSRRRELIGRFLRKEAICEAAAIPAGDIPHLQEFREYLLKHNVIVACSPNRYYLSLVGLANLHEEESKPNWQGALIATAILVLFILVMVYA